MTKKEIWVKDPIIAKLRIRMLQHSKADDNLLSAGKIFTIREFVELAFKEVGIEIEWQGEGVNEKGIVKAIKNDVLSDKLRVTSNEFFNKSLVTQH